jgi:hypothetical protein
VKNTDLRSRVEGINRFLEAVYGVPLKMSDVLVEGGMSPDQVALLRRTFLPAYLTEVCGSLVLYLQEILPERHAFTLGQRYCLDTWRQPTLEQVGEKLGVTRERARQLQEKGGTRLRTPKRRARIRELLLEAARATLQRDAEGSASGDAQDS